MDSQAINGLIVAVVGGGLMTGLAALLTVRSGRERTFSERVDARLADLEQKKDELERANRVSEERILRLRLALRQAGVDPDTVDPHKAES